MTTGGRDFLVAFLMAHIKFYLAALLRIANGEY